MMNSGQSVLMMTASESGMRTSANSLVNVA